MAEARHIGQIPWGELPGDEEYHSSSMEVEEVETTTMGSSEGRGMGAVLDFMKEETIGVTIYPASLCPPPLAGEDDHSTISSVLLDVKAYIADRRNATTAKSFTRARHEIQATLCAAHPPRVSHLCIHCPALPPGDFGTEPRVLATTEDLVLFIAGVCNRSYCFEQEMQDYFIYQAAPPKHQGCSGPSLTRLPHPGPERCFGITSVGILSGGAGGGFLQRHGPNQYVIAVLRRSRIRDNLPVEGAPSFYDLYRFNSNTGRWTTDVLQLGPMEPSPGYTFFFHNTDRVITLGGGFMGWVDLSQGILLCNVLIDDPELHYIPLPPELTDATTERDVAVVHGHIKFVEHQTHVRPRSIINGTYISDNWTATIRTWQMNDLDFWEGEWDKGYTVDASRMSAASWSKLRRSYQLPALPRMHTGHPTISLDEGDVVYILAKVDHRDKKAFVLAVDMRNGTLQEAEYFAAERTIGFSFSYTQSRVSGYLKAAPGKKKKQNKRPGVLLGSSTRKKPGLNMLT